MKLAWIDIVLTVLAAIVLALVLALNIVFW
jgi:hypothetical protein